MKMVHIEPIGRISAIPLCDACGRPAKFAVDIARGPNPAELPPTRHVCDRAPHLAQALWSAQNTAGATSVRVIGKGFEFTLSVVVVVEERS